MSKLLMVLMVIGLTGCGLQRQVNELKNREAQGEVDSRARDTFMQAQIDAIVASLNVTQNQLVAIDNSLANTQTTLAQQDTALQTQVSALQAQQATMLVSLATLQGYTNIVSLKDPCGAQGAYNEVFLKLSNGTYIASFSDNAAGQNTRFTVLTDGNFVTTDGTHCNFTVSGGGTVISNEHN